MSLECSDWAMQGGSLRVLSGGRAGHGIEATDNIETGYIALAVFRLSNVVTRPEHGLDTVSRHDYTEIQEGDIWHVSGATSRSTPGTLAGSTPPIRWQTEGGKLHRQNWNALRVLPCVTDALAQRIPQFGQKDSGDSWSCLPVKQPPSS